MAFPVDWNILTIVIFLIVVGFIIARDRDKFKREAVIFFLRRTQRGKEFIIRLGTRFPRFWKAFGNVGVAVGFIGSLFSFYTLFLTIYLFVQLLLAGQAPTGAGIVLPTISATPEIRPGVFGIPFWYWIISIFVLLVVHEGMHGILAARERIKIKSLGIILFTFFPIGAFVEPDDKEMLKKSRMAQLRVLAGGSFANLITALVVAAIVMPAFSGFYEQTGVFVLPIEEYPAADVNLTGTITEINGKSVKNVTDLLAHLRDVEPGDNVEIKALVVKSALRETKTFNLIAVQRPEDIPGESKGFIGITFDPRSQAVVKVKEDYGDYRQVIAFLAGDGFFPGLLGWIFLLNFAVGLFNLLPLPITDGGKMWDIVIKKYAPKRAKSVMNGLIIFTALLVLLIFVLQFVPYFASR